MAQTTPSACPVCGADAQPMRDVLAALAERGGQARAAARRRAESRPPRPRGGLGTGTGAGITFDEFLLGAAAAVAGGVVRGLWRKTAKPVAGSVLARLEGRGQAGCGRMIVLPRVDQRGWLAHRRWPHARRLRACNRPAVQAV